MQIQKMNRWAGSALFAVVGAVAFILSVAWNHTSDGLWFAGTSLVFATILAMGGRSDLLRTVRGDGDERGARVVEQTSNIVLNLFAMGGVVGAVIEQAQGIHAGPWSLGTAVGGAVYLVTFLTVRAFS